MFLKDLLDVTSDCNLYMYNKNTSETIPLDKELLKKLRTYFLPCIDKLKVKNIYADCGLQVEIKFDKDVYKAIKKYQKTLDKQ